jgi:FlaG/FlaF family flagellin (archaellin)
MDAGDDQKLTVLTTDVHAGSYFNPNSNQYLDRQFTHFDGSDEFYFEFDTSSCGTGSNSCWYTSSYYFYNNWVMQHTTVAGSGYNGMASSSQRSNLDELHRSDGGYLTTAADDGPGMNLLYLYDSGEDAFAMVGIGSSPSISEKLSGGSSAASSYGYGYTKSFKITLGSDYGGQMGKFSFGNATGGAGTNANRLCVTSNGFTYFMRSPYSSRDQCSGAYYYAGSYSGSTSYAWAGWALGMGYYGRMAASGGVTYKVGGVAPTPDTFSPDITHSALADSHSKSRTISASMSDAGDPPSGLNVSTTAGVGPTMYYRVTPDGGSAGSWTSEVMSPGTGTTRAECVLSICSWSADIDDLERGDSVEYYMTAQDVSTVSSGINTETTSTESFSVGDPNKMFVVEWRDMQYTNSADRCSYQAVFYDVTNEIEFKYDDACTNSYDAATVGFMDQTRTKGQTIRHSTSTQYITGTNPHTNNYRISTDSGDGAWESFDRGMTGLVNADASAIIGSSGGTPSGYYCASSYYWNTWKSKCADNIAMPEGFNFTYFGTDYNHTDSNDRIHLGRHGNMHFIDNGATSIVRSMTTWYGNMPQLPYSSSSFARAGLIAPYWSYYGTYYCYQSSNADCGVYYRTMPFEGKGTDVTSDITQDTTWDLTDSPIRINPSSDYLTISADLTIEAGTVIQVGAGKGISFDGACDQMTINGNSTDHVLFEGQSGADWIGMAFTAACSTGTDDRHVFSYVDFKNTSDAAIAAGSRHGSNPSSNGNVGNFTMDHVTFTNVGSAFSHGSGQGTVVSMNEFEVSGADGSCFNFAENSVVSLTEGTIENCNTDGGASDGAIVNVAGSTTGSLFLENTTITNAYVNLIDVDLEMVTVSNVTATATSAQSGDAIGSAAGAGSEVVLNNFDADDYASVSIDAMSVVMLTTVDFGTAAMSFYPGGSSASSAAGASGDNAVFDDVTGGSMMMRNLQPGTFDDVSVGDLGISGTPATSTVLNINNLDAEVVTLSGCGWNVIADSMDAERLSSNGCSAAQNTIVVSDSTITHTDSTHSAFFARYTDLTIGETAVTSTTAGSGTYLAETSTNSDIRLIEVTQDGNDCADTAGATGDCDVDVGSSTSEVWYGGLATVRTYRIALVGGNPTNIYKGGHTVTAAVVDGSSSELFEVGSHVTDTTPGTTLGSTNVWVITGDESGNSYGDHNLRAFGPAGQNETMTGDSWYPTAGFTIGSSIDLLLEPAPVDFDQAGMDCAWMDAYVDPNNGASLPTNGTTASGHTIFEFDGTPMTLSADLNLDGCKMILKGSSLKVKSTATSSPVLTLSNGGSIAVTVSPDTGAVGSIRAISSSYGLHLDIVSGSLILDGGTLRDVAQDTSTGAALMIGDGATLQMMDGATIYGSAANSDSMATVKVDGGTVNIADSSIINNGQTGTALWVEAAGGSIDNIVVKNAAVGIQAYNGAPQIDGFTATDNVVGLDVYGGMSLPTLYRSTLLSGQSTGWTTYKIDLSTYLANDYLQVGWNSIYGGGNAHPTYNYATSKYYMITDRYNIELEDDAGNAWNITDSDDLGYYPYSAADPASGDGTHATYTTGASGGVPSWNCNSYGYSYGPNYPSSFDGYFYYIWQSMAGTNPGYPGYYSAPAQFGFDWENIDGVSPTGSYAYYPYHYWGYYYTSYHGGQGVYKPPEGYVGGSYNVCLDYAYSYYMSAGQGARLTMPMIDVSASNISKVSLYIDVLHNRADNFQDRLEFVARSSNSVTDLIDASYVRESGTPLFKDGIITGADTGVVVGGAFAAAHFQDITVTNPTNSGMEVSGQVASTVDGFDVTGGDYGVLVGNSASGSLDLENIALDGQNNAGVYYAKGITGTMSGSVVNSAGAAFEYGQNTDNDVTFDGISISSNAVGIETSGDGDITMTDVTMGNTKDVVINSAANVDFIEGTVDSSSVDVLGTGMFTRMRQLDVSLTADGAAVTGATVTLVDGDGASAGNGITDSSGIAQDLTYVTATVDSTGLNTPSLAGYEVMSVAEVEYYYTSSSDNTADFRYASQGVTLTDASGNAETVPLTTQITERVCWYSTNTAYTTVSPCKGTFSTSGTRTLDDGNGGTIKEYGYFAGLTTSQSNKVIMLDTPYMYLKTNQDYDFNGSTLLSTGAYDYFNTQRWYSQFPYGAGVYMNDASVYGVASDSSDGSMYGVEIGYYGSPITNIVANNTVFSNVAKIEATNGYKYSNRYWEIEDVSITNSSISHFQGYQQLNNAIQYTDICLVLGGGDGAVVSGNTFNDCGVGVMLQRSAYFNYHTADEWGADNATISNNVFNDGGEIADIWLYSNGHSDDAVITGNTINSGSAAVAAIGVYNGKHTRMTISDNTINAGTDGIYVSNGVDYHITGNTINGIGDAAYAGMSIVGGYGDIDNNTLVDADGGLILDSASAPPAPTTSLCSIGRYSYNYGPATCNVNLATGKTMTVNIETDSWGYEASITLLKPDGTTQSWPTWTFNSNSEYTLGTYTDSGNYTLTLRDSYGDGGTNVFMVEGGAAGGYSGPMIADNSITSSPGRTAPSAVGMVFEDCSSVSINSARNTVTLSDNAMVISNCDVSDTSSVLQGQGDSTTVGIDADDPNGDLLTLTGTTIAGFATGVEKTSGELTLTGDASISGDDYGAYVDDATVVAINAAVNGGSTGTGLHVVDSDDVWVYPMNASGLVGMYVENSPFRWDGGTSTADTTLEAVESIGSVENMTWSTSTVQIDAGSNAYVTSIGNTITASKLNVASSATIDEANLFTMGSTHLTAAPSNEVAMLIQSTDGTRASYVSTSFQPEVMVVDGDNSDWNGGNALNPSGYAMPGVMSGDATNDMMVTYIEGDDLYIGLTGEDLTASDVLIYLSVDGSGSSTGYNLGGAHTLPFQANYVLWADSDSSFDLYSYGFLGWGPTTLSSANVDVASSSTLTEISIPFSRIGGTPSQVDIVAIVQGETTADVSTVHPTQTIDSVNTLQSFSEYMTVELTHDDLSDGAIADEVLVYRSYKGSNTPSVAKNYDVMIKTEADCEYDWATATDLSLATNVAINLNMARACPEILSTLADITVTEDSAAYTFSLTNLVDDVQDLEADLTWASSDSNLVAFDDNDVVAWNQNGQTMTITPLADQFGTLEYDFVVTDSHGLTDSQSITFEVTNVNDAPVICNVQEVDCMPIISTDQLADGTPVNNILAEGFGSWTKFLGDVSNASSSYIRDMANEQSPDRQSYDWSAAVDSSCVAFGVEVDALNNLVITENTANEKGGMCTITLDLSDNGNENTDATSFVVDFSVAPVNDAPVISLQDANGQNLLLNTAGDRATGEGEYISMTEDDTNADNLTWDLLPLMSDIDHDVPTDHTWTVEPTSQCTYTNYFTTAIVGTDLVFTLIPDATTNGYDWEVDYMNDNGIHQLRPNGQTFCAINLVLKDTATAPSHTPNYDNQVMPIADYQQGTDDVIMYVTVERVAENVADYSLDDVSGINFNGITNIMTGTYIPVSVNIDAGGDEGPYNYDHMLAVTFHTDGHSEAETTKYYNVPDYGTSITVNEEIFMTKDTTKVEVSMDVLTCLDEVCDLTVPASERFQADDPTSHRSNSGGSQGSDWSAPGQYGQSSSQTSERRPMLEDSYWCNNRLTTLDLDTAEASSDWGKCNEFAAGSESFGATDQPLPAVVRTIGANSVPSFAPSIVVVSLTGLFVSALAFSSRRAEDEEEVTENLEDDDMAVSPVIATILMVAITVVLSGVIYVWASSLADTDVKGVPRITFDMEDVNGFDVDDGHWRISVQSSETDLATQAVQVRVQYVDGAGAPQVDTYNLADTNGVYGFNPANSDSMVTFVDQVNTEGEDKVSTFNTGDEIFVRTHLADGTPLEDVKITLIYSPGTVGDSGSLLRTWNGLSYNLDA